MNPEFLKLIKKDFMYGVEEPWCNNQGVAILPYVLEDNQYFFLLLTNENNPLFKDKKISKYSSITGGLENLDPYQTVINEMLEETGINVKNDKSKIYYLGKHYANKSSTKLWYFFTIDLTNLNLNLNAIYKGKGDGTKAEEVISAEFVNYKDLNKSNDALCLVNKEKFFFTLKEKEDLKEKIENEEKEKFAYNIFEFIFNDFNDKKPLKSYESFNAMTKNWNNHVDKRLSSIDKSWMIFDSSSEKVQNFKRKAEKNTIEKEIMKWVEEHDDEKYSLEEIQNGKWWNEVSNEQWNDWNDKLNYKIQKIDNSISPLVDKLKKEAENFENSLFKYAINKLADNYPTIENNSNSNKRIWRPF
ncbi:hypothetical protein [Spiroplasma endosymbiont of Phycita roborella]|uniref:hypothetical protein n=2 Tax=Spiroplasma endosymbiont of Phycita roborella TaxID=3066311 RepID=UPI00313CBC3E